MPEAGWYPDPERADTLRYWDGAAWREHRAPREALPMSQTMPPGVIERPQPRLIRSPSEAEEVAAEWLRWLGFDDAEVTGAGADGGVDVRAKSMVAQVKMHLAPIGRPDLQRLHGVAVTERALSVFFSLSDYSPEAKEWAEQVGMTLFRFSHVGEAEPANSFAEALVERAEHHSPRSSEPWWAIPLGCDDATACESLLPRPGRLQRQPDRILWVSQGWLPIATFRYEFTYVAVQGWADHFLNERVRRRPYGPPLGPHTEHRVDQAGAAIEMVEGYAVGVPPSQVEMTQVSVEYMNLHPRFRVRELGGMIAGAWHEYNPYLWDPQHDVAVHRYNVPPNVVELAIISTGTFLMPIFAGFIATPNGNRIAVVEGITGSLDQHLSAHFTRHAPSLLDELYKGRPVDPF